MKMTDQTRNRFLGGIGLPGQTTMALQRVARLHAYVTREK
jgi:hypothetical protein